MSSVTDGRLLLFILRAVLGIILLSDLTFKNTYAPYVTKPVLSGMPIFNASLTIGDGSNNDFIRRAAIQNFILSPLAPYRVTLPNEMINCTDSSCLAVRIHWNIEYTAVPPPTWTTSDPFPDITTDWQTQFDPDHPWTTFKVQNASTVQMEFSYPQQDVVFVGGECQMYGYPYLAMEICMKQGDMPHQVFVGTQLRAVYANGSRWCLSANRTVGLFHKSDVGRAIDETNSYIAISSQLGRRIQSQR